MNETSKYYINLHKDFMPIVVASLLLSLYSTDSGIIQHAISFFFHLLPAYAIYLSMSILVRIMLEPTSNKNIEKLSKVIFGSLLTSGGAYFVSNFNFSNLSSLNKFLLEINGMANTKSLIYLLILCLVSFPLGMLNGYVRVLNLESIKE